MISIELLILFYILYVGGVYTMLSSSISGEQSCPPGKKESVSYVDAKIVNKTCISLQNIDVGEYNVPSLSLSPYNKLFHTIRFCVAFIT